MALGALFCLSFPLYAGVVTDPLKGSQSSLTQANGGGLNLEESALPFENPSSMASSQGRLFVQSSTLLGDVMQNVFAYTFPNADHQHQWGLALVVLGIDDLIATQLDGSGHISFDAGNSFFYDYRVGVLSYAFEFSEQWRLGSAVKYYTQTLEGYGSGSGWGCDLSVRFFMSPQTQLGLMWHNLLGGQMGWSNGAKDAMESYIQFAGNHRILLLDQPLKLTAGLDLESQGIPAHLGACWTLAEVLSLRGGIDQTVSAKGGKTSYVTDLTFGVGLKARPFVLDYAFHPYAGFSDLSSHIFSVSYEFNH